MKKRSFRSTFVSVILVITVAISIVNLAVYGINIKKIRQVEVLKMKTAGPGTATQVVSYLIYMNAFQYFKQGYASAMAYILFIIVFIASIVQLRFSEKNSI